MVGKEGEVAARKHSGRKMTHDGFGLDMEVAEHFVGAPAAKKSNAVRVNIGAKEGHCASCPEGPGRNVFG